MRCKGKTYSLTRRQIIKRYYINNYDLIFDNIEDPSWRVWRFRKVDGTYTMNRKRINSRKKMIKMIISNLPETLYYSVSRFLVPHKNYGKNPKYACNQMADNLFLYSDLAFDIDDDNLEVAKADSIKVLDYMNGNESNYSLKRIVFSGTRGFHLIYKQKQRYHVADPVKRRMRYEIERERISNEIIKLNLQTMDPNHKNIIIDQYRVLAAPYSIKTKSGYVVYPLTEDQLRYLTIREILDIIPNIYSPVRSPNRYLGESVKGSMIKVGFESPLFPADQHHIRGKPQSGLRGPPPIFYEFITNKIRGTKDLYIPVLKFWDASFNEDRLKETQNIYNLTSFYIMRVKDGYYAICLKAVTRKRLIKIMKFARANNLNRYIHSKSCWLRISPKMEGNKLIEDNIKLKTIISSDEGLSSAHSKPHINLLNSLKGIDIHHNNLCGDDRNNIYCARIG